MATSGAKLAQRATPPLRAATRRPPWLELAAAFPICGCPAVTCLLRRRGATFSASWQTDGAQLTFRKPLPDGTTVQGAKTLTYYIGSGAHARGFLFQEQDQAFQAPVAYYGDARRWDLAPGYEGERSILLGRKIEPGCLNCHASGLRSAGPTLFEEGAVSCERCHGPGERHVSSVQSGLPRAPLNIVNPAKLEPESRDGVCAQCHLMGETRVAKTGRSETTFRPGDRLAQHVLPFVWSSPDKADLKVIGHFEGLWQSKCKRVSGDKLSCLTCHDPHTTIPAAEKSAYYREKCLACHQQASCKLPSAARNREGDSCIACHMPSRPSSDGQHTAFTDHLIRCKAQDARPTRHSEDLVPFWTSSASDRDYALAYADKAWLRGDAASIRRAHEKLQAVLSQAPNDAAVAAQLAYTDDLGGDTANAEALYRVALKADPENLIALTNLAAHLAQQGQLSKAIDLWRKALVINPGLLIPGLNLARAEDAQGHRREALEIISQVLSLNPDSQEAFDLRRKLVP
jgi:hypothetical protein